MSCFKLYYIIRFTYNNHYGNFMIHLVRLYHCKELKYFNHMLKNKATPNNIIYGVKHCTMLLISRKQIKSSERTHLVIVTNLYHLLLNIIIVIFIVFGA